MSQIVLSVYGTPQPQGSKTAYVRGGKPIIVEGKGPGRANHAAWRQAVATAARDYQAEHNSPLLDEALSIELWFYFPRPKSVSPKKRRHPSVKPDIDKLARSVLDAIKGTLITDDALIVDCDVHKRYSDYQAPGALIIVSTMDEAWGDVTIEEAG